MYVAPPPSVSTTTVLPPVTDSPVMPVALHAAVCPNVQPSPTPGRCAESCSSNMDCSGGQMCCASACGRTCVDPDRVPYYSVPLECPSAKLLGERCEANQRSCTDDSVCAQNQLCCQNGACGRYCVNAVDSRQPCFAVRELVLRGSARPGAFVPMCQSNGNFNATQFHGSTGLSWCVNVQTGYPVSSFYPRGSIAQCSSEI